MSSVAPDGSVSEPLVASLAGPAIMLPRRPVLSLTSRDVPRFGAPLEKSHVRIRGRTEAALSGQVVDLRYTRNAEGTGRAKLIRHVRVRRDGSFGDRWRVPGRGPFSVSAGYRSQDRRFVSTRSECRLGFNRG